MTQVGEPSPPPNVDEIIAETSMLCGANICHALSSLCGISPVLLLDLSDPSNAPQLAPQPNFNSSMLEQNSEVSEGRGEEVGEVEWRNIEEDEDEAKTGEGGGGREGLTREQVCWHIVEGCASSLNSISRMSFVCVRHFPLLRRMLSAHCALTQTAAVLQMVQARDLCFRQDPNPRAPSPPLSSPPLLSSPLLSSPLLLSSPSAPSPLFSSSPLLSAPLLSSSPLLASPRLSSSPLLSSPLLSSPLLSSPLLSAFLLLSPSNFLLCSTLCDIAAPQPYQSRILPAPGNKPPAPASESDGNAARAKEDEEAAEVAEAVVKEEDIPHHRILAIEALLLLVFELASAMHESWGKILPVFQYLQTEISGHLL
eukprot:763708-Hanusia_phi.AAC.1